MFAKLETSNNFVQRVVALFVLCAVLLWSVGSYAIAEAANLTNVSDTLSDSDASVVSDHIIEFTVPTGSVGLAAGEAITVTFPTGFVMGSVAVGDVDMSVNSTDQTLATTASGATWGVGIAGQVLTITSGTATLSAGDVIQIKIGTNATGGANQITNPAIGSYELIITSGSSDTGRTRVAIIDNVLVTASVDTVFDFVITGLATSTDVNGVTTTGSTTPTAIPFGKLTAGQVETLGQRLNVTTNAINGFVVTVEQDSNLQSSTGADIDAFIDGTYTNTPTTWVSPTGTLGTEDTYGHWGLTSEDSDLNTDEFGTALFVAASTTPRVVFSHNSVTDGTTADIGETDVAYQIEITSLQEAADDYQTTLTYIATPTF